MIVVNFYFKLSFQEAENSSYNSVTHTESFNKRFEQIHQFIDERTEREEEPLQEFLQGIPNNSQITQQSPLKFRLKKSKNPNHLNSFPQLAFQNNIYYFFHKNKNPVFLHYRCKNCQQNCKGKIFVSLDQKVIKQTAHSCNGYIDNATIVSVSSKIKFNLFFIITDP